MTDTFSPMSDAMPPPPAPEAVETLPETPNAKRLSVPDFHYPKGGSLEEKNEALVDCLLEIAEHLRYLRTAEESRHNRIEKHELDIADLQKRVEKLEREAAYAKLTKP